MTFHKLWQYSHTHTFCPGDKSRHKNCFLIFSFLLMKNARRHPLNYLYPLTVCVKYVIYKLTQKSNFAKVIFISCKCKCT